MMVQSLPCPLKKRSPLSKVSVQHLLEKNSIEEIGGFRDPGTNNQVRPVACVLVAAM